MAENRRFYYLKLKEGFYNSETMVVLESMPDGLLYSNLLLKMYLMSLKSGGILMLNEHLPHTVQTIATFTRHQIGTVERAIKVFMEFGLVEVLTDGAFYMADIQLLIGQSSTEGERKKRERSRLQRQKLLPSGKVDICPPIDPVDKCPPILGSTEKVEIGEYMQGNYNIYAKKPCRIRKCAPIRYFNDADHSLVMQYIHAGSTCAAPQNRHFCV